MTSPPPIPDIPHPNLRQKNHEQKIYKTRNKKGKMIIKASYLPRQCVPPPPLLTQACLSQPGKPALEAIEGVFEPVEGAVDHVEGEVDLFGYA
jgi:hypothetical protein